MKPQKPRPPRNLILGEGQQPPPPTAGDFASILQAPLARHLADEYDGSDWADRERAWLKQNRREIYAWLFAAFGWGLLVAVLFLEAAGVL